MNASSLILAQAHEIKCFVEAVRIIEESWEGAFKVDAVHAPEKTVLARLKT